MTRYDNAKLIETEFKRAAISRISQKKSGNSAFANDAGYWDGGRCNWGAAHNLVEDCEKLAEFFGGITELRNCRKELLTFNNQEEFNKSKQALLEKVNEAINNLQMRTSNNSSIGGVCIIWESFADHFNKIINDFRNEVERLKNDIENVAYNEAKELQKLLSDERKLQKEIEENERKARNEPDENKKRQFIFLAGQAKDKWKKLLERKKQLKTARLGDDFNPDQHIDDFLKAIENKLSGKNRPPRTRTNPQQQSTSFGNPSGSNTNPQSTPYSSSGNYSSPNNNEQKPFTEKYWKELLLGGAVLLGAYYILNQPDHE